MTYKVLKPFQVKARGKFIEFKEGQSISIPEEKAIKLIATGMVEPLEILEQFNTVFQNAVSEINRNYQPGLINRISQKYPERWSQSIQAENKINQLWDNNIEPFRKAVAEWREIELEMIRLFTQDSLRG